MITISINKLKVNASIGVYPHEKEALQPLLIDMNIHYRRHKVADELSSTLDYDAVMLLAKNVIGQGHFDLLETLSDAIGIAVMKLPGVKALTLTLYKPNASNEADSISVTQAFKA